MCKPRCAAVVVDNIPMVLAFGTLGSPRFTCRPKTTTDQASTDAVCVSGRLVGYLQHEPLLNSMLCLAV